jgi:hypothetical protein
VEERIGRDDNDAMMMMMMMWNEYKEATNNLSIHSVPFSTIVVGWLVILVELKQQNRE